MPKESRNNPKTGRKEYPSKIMCTLTTCRCEREAHYREGAPMQTLCNDCDRYHNEKAKKGGLNHA